MLQALIFDIDGTLAETEEVHRSCFNKAFRAAGLEWYWDKSLYTRLLKTTGGKERIARFVSEERLQEIGPETLADLHIVKNKFYAESLVEGGLTLRPGVEQLIKDAQTCGLKIGIATTTSRSNLMALLHCCFGPFGDRIFDVIVCGEDVQRKKPNPEVYLLCVGQLGLEPNAALAFEDSGVGLKAALEAGIKTIVVPSLYTTNDDFTGADQVLPDLTNFHIGSVGPKAIK